MCNIYKNEYLIQYFWKIESIGITWRRTIAFACAKKVIIFIKTKILLESTTAVEKLTELVTSNSSEEQCYQNIQQQVKN